jgi:hypothetical protein
MYSFSLASASPGQEDAGRKVAKRFQCDLWEPGVVGRSSQRGA